MSTQHRGLYYEDISLGMEATFAKTVTEADIANFAGVSGDFNPVHVDADFASTTMFKGRIAHGMLSAAFISAVLGNKLPGPGAIYISQNLKFKAPVHIGDTVTAKVQVIDLMPEKHRVTFRTTCSVKELLVVDGEAVLMVPTVRDESTLIAASTKTPAEASAAVAAAAAVATATTATAAAGARG
jgi:3-hydroxybutyryl-CoA dehydratase